ncbi:Hcp family type VI secretion system effector [Cohnella rhizosphaerae]|uniref:Type VI secretion system tube protein Hcp n=1 Tax=Cohnella rhizosphaerae TaxID=1457232 RepID=A0A9X4KR63_9BACL|nr:type VI secretion system tube protein Hcp [Cohnella rhizosphaerae]MDG0809315.1 type VI secretion system tube protein Hcp [Cohnella rhizosphaerae]
MLARLLNRVLVAALVSGMLFLSPAPPSADAAETELPSILLTLEGIPGEFDGKDKQMKDAIVVNSFHYGVAAEAPSGGGGTPGKPETSPVEIAKSFDSSSLPLLRALTDGKAIKEGYLYFQTRGAGQSRTYMVVHLTDIRITGYSSASGSQRPNESIKLSARSVLFKYMPEKPGGGTDPDPVGEVLTKYRFDPIQAVTPKGNAYVKGFTVTLHADGVGDTPAQTRYRVNGGAWIDYTAPFEIYAADTHTVEYYTVGGDGRIEATNVMDFDQGTFTGHGSY